jgi:hypothetical protein
MVPAFSSARLWFCLLLALTSLAGRAMESGSAVDSREIENLAAFARVYGYVRFFCPSDAATRVDWDKLAILGAEAVRSAPDGTALRTGLLQVFQPIAPGLRLADNLSMLEELPENSTETKREPLTFWQYRGVNLAGKPGPYQQVRVVVGANINGRKPLFEPAVVPQPLALQLAPELALAMPTALTLQKDETTAGGRAADLDALLARLAALDLKAVGVADWRVRVGGIVTVWSVFQHFHPYLDGAGVQWEDALRPALRRTLHDATVEDYYYTLSEMIAQSRDGHGYVYAPLKSLGGLPVQVALAEEQIVVVGTAGEAPLQKGDVITRIDGIDALEVLRDRERYTAGSPHLRRFRALNQFGEGPVDSGWSYFESAWPVKPKGPRFRGRVAFIIEPGCVSYGETCMAMIAGYKLATQVGEATAGCNGNANFVELPAGFRVMWTGMDVRRHDHTSFYGVGFGPDVPVRRTLRGIKEGRDEFLEAAIAFLENAE